MRQLVLQMQITVDGFVAGPNGEADWVFKTLDEAADKWLRRPRSSSHGHTHESPVATSRTRFGA
jgi:hypothetical protein